jgi:hypothetical protein
MNCSGYNKNYGYPGVKGAKTPKECPISFHEGVCSIQKPALEGYMSHETSNSSFTLLEYMDNANQDRLKQNH